MTVEVPESLSDGFRSHYELLELLGRGAMGCVYRARDAQLGRTVALKLLRIEGDSVMARRFEAEARLLASLSHPRVLKIFDFGWDSQIPYISTAFVDGQTLRARMQASTGETLPLPEFYRISGQVLDALAYVHERGVIHRDVKPENVLLDRAGDVYLADFGLAVPDRTDRTRLTEMGMVVGTVRYMAPELIGIGDHSPRSDLYSVAVICFEMLAGRPPFPVNSVPDMIASKVGRPADRLRDVDGRYSEALEAVLDRGLARFPEDRHASAAEFAAELDRCRRGRSTRPSAVAGRRRPAVPVAGGPGAEGANRAIARGREGGRDTARSAAVAAAVVSALVLSLGVWRPGARPVAPPPPASPIASTSATPVSPRAPRGPKGAERVTLDRLFERCLKLQHAASALPVNAGSFLLVAQDSQVAAVQREALACLQDAVSLMERGQTAGWEGPEWLEVDEILAGTIRALARTRASPRGVPRLEELVALLRRIVDRPSRGAYDGMLRHTVPVHLEYLVMASRSNLKEQVGLGGRADEVLAGLEGAGWEVADARVRLLLERCDLIHKSVHDISTQLRGQSQRVKSNALQKDSRDSILVLARRVLASLPSATPRPLREQHALSRALFAAYGHLGAYKDDPREAAAAVALAAAVCPLMDPGQRSRDPERGWLRVFAERARRGATPWSCSSEPPR